MKVAALFDVHGNLPALEAVLAEVERQNVDVVVFGGDLVWGPWPEETLRCAESLQGRARFLHGNCETLVQIGASEGHRWARDCLDESELARIAAWPGTLVLDIAGLGPTLFCHATPGSEEKILLPDSGHTAWSEALDGISERTVVCGHTHLQFDRYVAGVRVVNPGSVGAPVDKAYAWWAVLGPDVELKATEYDIEDAIDAASQKLPARHVHSFERRLRTPPTAEQRRAALRTSDARTDS